MNSSPETLPAGTLLGHYEIIEELGRGGMGVVYRARDQHLHRDTAIKCLFEGLVRDPKALARFKNEARAVAELNHACIATVYDVDEADGRQFIAMELVEGQGLDTVVAEHPMSIEETLRMGDAVARGLAHAHSRGIIHRDIKGANIMRTEEGGFKILDFGLAHRGDATRITTEGFTMGTMSYMSPEQLEGAEVDARSDIWSLGVVLFECLTGSHPFRADAALAMVHRIQDDSPEPPTALRSGIPMEFEQVVLRCLEKNPELRYQTANDLVADLARIGSRMSIPALKHRSSHETKSGVRRVAALAVGYALLAWIIGRELPGIVGRIEVSPHWTAVVQLVLLLALPVVVMAAWPKPDRRLRARFLRGGVAYVLACVVALSLLFHDKDLGAVTMTVTVEDEEGNPVERLVPKPEFRKRLAILPFENDTGDMEMDWAEYGLPNLLYIDVEQDMFVELYGGPYVIASRMKADGIDDLHEAPVRRLEAFCQRLGAEHYLRGSIRQAGEIWIVRMTLAEPSSGRVMKDLEYQNADVFALIDEASVELRRLLGVSPNHIEQNPDFAIADVTTKYVEALQPFSHAIESLILDFDFDHAKEYIDRALDIDSSFALAHFLAGSVAMLQGNSTQAQSSLEKAMRSEFRLPERIRFEARFVYFQCKAEFVNALRIIDNWTRVFPHDAQALALKSLIEEGEGRMDDAASSLSRATELDPLQPERQLRLCDLYRRLGDEAAADDCLTKFTETFPKDERGCLQRGEFLENHGKLEAARDAYARASLIKPYDVSVKLALAGLQERTGEFDACLAAYQEILDSASSTIDRWDATGRLIHHHRRLGQNHKALEYLKQLKGIVQDLAKVVLSQPPDEMLRLTRELSSLVLLECRCGSVEAEKSRRFQQSTESAPMQAPALLLFAADIEYRLGNIDTAGQLFDRAVGLPFYGQLRPILGDRFDYLRGCLAESNSEFDTALESFESARQDSPEVFDYVAGIVRVQKARGDTKEAEKTLSEFLGSFPAHPHANLALAQLLSENGRESEARGALSRAVRAWTDADEGFEPAAAALALNESLGIAQ